MIVDGVEKDATNPGPPTAKDKLIENLKDVTPKYKYSVKVGVAINIEIRGRFIPGRRVCLPFIHLDQHSFRHNNH